jgi:hypothetical protein
MATREGGRDNEPGRAAERHERGEDTGDQRLEEVVHCVEVAPEQRSPGAPETFLFY